MDANRFDRLSRAVSDQMDRRGMFKVAAGSALGLLGLSALDGDVSAKGFDGDRCKKNKNCGTGLECRGSKKKRKDNKGKCRYRDGCGEKATPARITMTAAAAASAVTRSAGARIDRACDRQRAWDRKLDGLRSSLT